MDNAKTNIRAESSVIGLIGADHFLSHFFIFVLPPLLPLMKLEFGVSYAALGLAITVFNLTSALSQTPAGFLIDRFGALAPLLTGIFLGSISFISIGLMPSYSSLLFFSGLAGIANSVYHPADYTILAASVNDKRMGRAFSLHTFAGYAGGAAAPLTMALVLEVSDWKMGLILSGLLGICVFLLILIYRNQLIDQPSEEKITNTSSTNPKMYGFRLLLSLPVLMCFLFFVFIAMSASGIQGFGVVAFMDLHGATLQSSQMALTGYLVGSATGILVGGYIADKTSHHERVAMIGFIATAFIVFAVGRGSWSEWGIIIAMSFSGLLFGMIMPSRDMLVKAITPTGQSGKVFGFVTTGFNVGGMLTPPLFGWIMDIGEPVWLFILAPAFMLVAAGTVVLTRSVQQNYRQQYTAVGREN